MLPPQVSDHNSAQAQTDPLTMDLLCLGCGYNLRGLQAAGNCPECGRKINDSLPEMYLKGADPVWVRRMNEGCRFLLFYVLAQMGGYILIWMMIASWAHRSWTQFAIIWVIGNGLMLAPLVEGTRRLTYPRNATTGIDSHEGIRRALRYALGGYLVIYGVSLFPRLWSEPQDLGVAVLFVVAEIFLVYLRLCFLVGVIIYLRKMALCIGEPALSHLATRTLRTTWAVVIAFWVVIFASMALPPLGGLLFVLFLLLLLIWGCLLGSLCQQMAQRFAKAYQPRNMAP